MLILEEYYTGMLQCEIFVGNHTDVDRNDYNIHLHLHNLVRAFEGIINRAAFSNPICPDICFYFHVTSQNIFISHSSTVKGKHVSPRQ
jgi:hypothetical protein